MDPKEVACTKSSFYHQAEREQIKGPRTQKKASLSFSRLGHPQGWDSDFIRDLSYHRNSQPTGGVKKNKPFWKAKARWSREAACHCRRYGGKSFWEVATSHQQREHGLRAQLGLAPWVAGLLQWTIIVGAQNSETTFLHIALYSRTFQWWS